MLHEKIIKRKNGRQYNIMVSLKMINWVVSYRFDVYYREKGGVQWHNLPNTLYDSQIKKLTSDQERFKHATTNTLRFVSLDEINEALNEAYDTLRPQLLYERCQCEGCKGKALYKDEEKENSQPNKRIFKSKING